MKKGKMLCSILIIGMMIHLLNGPAQLGASAGSTDFVWTSAVFGDSTKKTTNFAEPSNPGTALGTIKLTALEGGGKITGAHDGITFYYTEIDAAEDNFILSADIKVLAFAKPYPDNQEGFGLMARDAIGQNGSGVMSSSNLVAVGGYYGKTQAFIRTGSTNPFGNEGIVQMGTSWDTERPDAWNTYPAKPYRLTLQKTNTGYTASLNGSGDTTVTFYEPDALNAQDSKIYVGFYVARLATIEVSNVTFSVSDAASDPPKTTPVPTPVAPSFTMTSLSTSSKVDYVLKMAANVAGSVTVIQNGIVIATDEAVFANQEYAKNITLLKNKTNSFAITFIPDSGQLLTNYNPIVINKSVYMKTYETPDGAIHVSTDGTSSGTGTIEEPLDINTAIRYVKDGQTIYMHGGIYNRTETVKIYSGCDGSAGAMKTLAPYNGERVVLDFGTTSAGFSLAANYWNIRGLEITRAKGIGITVSGSYNKIERCKAYANGDSGLQISRSGTVGRELWPSYNLILNCESFDNKDLSENNADGFAAKLTSGVGNVFRGCIAHNNIDDGWDLYTKIEMGPIGAILIENCIAYENGTLSNGYVGKGDKNGFKLGGEGIAVPHIIRNSIAFYNGARGFDSNTNPQVMAYDCVSYDNKGANISFRSYEGIPLNFTIDRFWSYRSGNGTVDQYPLGVESGSNYFYNGTVCKNKAGDVLASLDFESLTPSLPYQRDGEGNIIWGNFLRTMKQYWAEKMVINNGGTVTDPYGITGASIVRADVTGLFLPLQDGRTVTVKGTSARYTYYNGAYKFVALVDGSVAPDDIETVVGTPRELKYGDASLDGEINGADLNHMKAIIMGNRIPTDFFEYLASDVNGNGAVDGADINSLKGFIWGNITSLSAFYQ